MIQQSDFRSLFTAATGNAPFPWQAELYERWFSKGKIPSACDLPTGLGKTSVVTIWLIALANNSCSMPRRLVYVVNRRTVVDQTTNEIEALRRRLDNPKEYAKKPEDVPFLQSLRDGLVAICGMKSNVPLTISTLRGQFADNREWSADPSRPAVVCGTVDMIGSRLLFSGYGVGFKAKPLHAGFLGQDALLVHDEAHLEPAFQELIESIEKEQRERDRSCDLPWSNLRVMQLTATTRSVTDHNENFDEKPFELTDEEKNPPAKIPAPHSDEPPVCTVWRRMKARKQLYLHRVDEDKDVVAQIGELALTSHKSSGAAVLVFVRTVDDVTKVCRRLTNKKDGVRADHVQTLTGTMRGLERDRLAKSDPVFLRFLPEKSRNPEVELVQGTVYLVCTSAGQVGVDISADMVGDLSTFESMAQRFGRVNRYGARDDARIDVVYPASFDQKDKLTPARQATLKLLQQLNGDASPKAIGELPADQRLAAFAPIPTTLPATDILFDAWALTTIREKMPGRPHVEPYLHGIAEWQPPETNVAWRDEVWKLHRPFDRVSDRRDFERFAAELLDDYPLKPHELLHDRSKRVFEQLEILARKHPDKPVWVLDGDGAVEVTTLERLADTQRRDRVNDCTVLLPPNAGGLSGGMLDGSVEPPAAGSLDVADEWEHESGVPFRKRIQSDETQPTGMRLIRSIELSGDDEDDDNPLTWDWYSRVPEGSRTASKPVSWETHVADVVNHAKRIVPGLSLPHEIADAIILAAEFHDHGKRRERSQLTLGNARYPHVVLAKSGRRGGLLPEPFRHEFGSVLDAQGEARINNLPDQMKDLVLHLIAAHHGRARPHFPRGEDFDPERAMADAEELAIETPRRFARLQRKYGRWGLAYLESLLRAADWAASAEPSAYLDD